MADMTGKPSGPPVAHGEGNYASPKNISSQDHVDLGLTLFPGSQANCESLSVDQNAEAKTGLHETNPTGLEEAVAENAQLVGGKATDGREQFTTPGSEVKVASNSHLLPRFPNFDSFTSSTSLHFPTSLPAPTLSSQFHDTAGTVSTAPKASNLSSPSLDPILLPPFDLETEFPLEKVKSKPRKLKVPGPNSAVQKYFKTDAAFEKEWNRIANSERATVLLSLANLDRLSPYPPAKAVQPPLRYLPSSPILHTIKTTAIMTSNTETMESLRRQLAQANWQRDFLFEEIARLRAANQGASPDVAALRAENAQMRQNMQVMNGRLQTLAQNANQKVGALKATGEHWQKMYNSMAQIYHKSKTASETPTVSQSQVVNQMSLQQSPIQKSQQPQAAIQLSQSQAPPQVASQSPPAAGNGADAGAGMQNKVASPTPSMSVPNNPILAHGSVTGPLDSLIGKAGQEKKSDATPFNNINLRKAGNSSPAKKPDATPFSNISLQNTGDRVTLPSNFLPNGQPKSGITKKASKKVKEPRQEVTEKPGPEAVAALQAMKRKDRTWLKEAQPEHKRQRLDSIATNELLTGNKTVHDPVLSAMANFSNYFPNAESSTQGQTVDLTTASSSPAIVTQPATAAVSPSSSSVNPSTTTTAPSTPPSTVSPPMTNTGPQCASAPSMPNASAPMAPTVVQPEKRTQPATINPAVLRKPPMPDLPARRPSNMTRYLFETIPSFDLNNPKLTDDELVLAGFANRQEAVNYMDKLHKMRKDYIDSLKSDDEDGNQYRKAPEKIREPEPERRKTATPPKAKKTNPAQCAANIAAAEPKATTGTPSKPKKVPTPPKAKKTKTSPPKPTVTAPPGYFHAPDGDNDEEDERALEKEMEDALFADSSDDDEEANIHGPSLFEEEAANQKEFEAMFGANHTWTQDSTNNDAEESLRDVFNDVFGDRSAMSGFQAPFADAFGNLSAPATTGVEQAEGQTTVNTTNYESESEVSEEE